MIASLATMVCYRRTLVGEGDSTDDLLDKLGDMQDEDDE